MKGRLKDGQNPASLPEAPPENPSLNALSSRTVPPNSDAGAVKHNIGLSAVQPGQVIYTDVVINVNDISPHADPQSTTQKKCVYCLLVNCTSHRSAESRVENP